MPAPGGPAQQQEDSMALLWGLIGFFAILGIIWYSLHDQIVYGYLTLKMWEIDLLSLFTHSSAVMQAKAQMAVARTSVTEFSSMVAYGQLVGTYIRIPLTILMVFLMIVVFRGDSTRSFKRIYGMKTLAQAEVQNWPQIQPVIGLDLVHTDIDTGPWAMAMTPIQFCKKYNLIEEIRRVRTEGMSRKDAEKVEVMLKKGEANKVFALQVGPRWEGVNRLPAYGRALFAALAARTNADTKAAQALFQQLNRSSAKQNFDYTGVDALIKKHEGSKAVQRIIQDHAYILTVMAGMLFGARTDGVQATADFLWLKPIDRRLWYMLNTMGRQTPFVESAGPFAHFLAEREAGRKLIVPMVENATVALELALKSMIYNPDA